MKKETKQFQFISPQLQKKWGKLVAKTGSTHSGIMNELVASLKMHRCDVSQIIHGSKKWSDPKVFTKIESFIDSKMKLYDPK